MTRRKRRPLRKWRELRHNLDFWANFERATWKPGLTPAPRGSRPARWARLTTRKSKKRSHRFAERILEAVRAAVGLSSSDDGRRQEGLPRVVEGTAGNDPEEHLPPGTGGQS